MQINPWSRYMFFSENIYMECMIVLCSLKYKCYANLLCSSAAPLVDEHRCCTRRRNALLQCCKDRPGPPYRESFWSITCLCIPTNPHLKLEMNSSCCACIQNISTGPSENRCCRELIDVHVVCISSACVKKGQACSQTAKCQRRQLLVWDFKAHVSVFIVMIRMQPDIHVANVIYL